MVGPTMSQVAVISWALGPSCPSGVGNPIARRLIVYASQTVTSCGRSGIDPSTTMSAGPSVALTVQFPGPTGWNECIGVKPGLTSRRISEPSTSSAPVTGRFAALGIQN
jgi:hypothetical protein